jgi:PilZ domain
LASETDKQYFSLRRSLPEVSSDKRRSPRKKINTVGFLYTAEGWPLGECRIKDISTGGARLAHTLSDDVPAEFLLSFSRDGKVRRRCEVRWRSEKEIGVRFLS